MAMMQRGARILRPDGRVVDLKEPVVRVARVRESRRRTLALGVRGEHAEMGRGHFGIRVAFKLVTVVVLLPGSKVTVRLARPVRYTRRECGEVAPNGYTRCGLPLLHAGDHECDEQMGRHVRWPRRSRLEHEVGLGMGEVG